MAQAAAKKWTPPLGWTTAKIYQGQVPPPQGMSVWIIAKETTQRLFEEALNKVREAREGTQLMAEILTMTPTSKDMPDEAMMKRETKFLSNMRFTVISELKVRITCGLQFMSQ